MKIKCKQCGSSDYTVVGDGVMLFTHEVDLKHFPAELSDDEHKKLRENAIELFRTAFDVHMTAHRRRKHVV